MFASYVSDIYGRLVPVNIPTTFAPGMHQHYSAVPFETHLTQPWMTPQAGLPMGIPSFPTLQPMVTPPVTNIPFGLPQAANIPFGFPTVLPPMINVINPAYPYFRPPTMLPSVVPQTFAGGFYPNPAILPQTLAGGFYPNPAILPQTFGGGFYPNPSILPQPALAAC